MAKTLQALQGNVWMGPPGVRAMGQAWLHLWLPEPLSPALDLSGLSFPICKMRGLFAQIQVQMLPATGSFEVWFLEKGGNAACAGAAVF